MAEGTKHADQAGVPSMHRAFVGFRGLGARFIDPCCDLGVVQHIERGARYRLRLTDCRGKRLPRCRTAVRFTADTRKTAAIGK